MGRINEMATRSVRNVISESKVMQLLNVTRDQLDELRRSRGLPFIQVTKSSRIYFDDSLTKWLTLNEKSLSS